MTLFKKLAGKASALLNANGICSNIRLVPNMFAV